MEKGKELWCVFATEEKWNAAFSAVKSQFEVVDVLPEQQEAIKSFFLGGGGDGEQQQETYHSTDNISDPIMSEIRICKAENLSST